MLNCVNLVSLKIHDFFLEFFTIISAINSTEDKKMMLKDIYNWIQTNVPEFGEGTVFWPALLSHNQQVDGQYDLWVGEFQWFFQNSELQCTQSPVKKCEILVGRQNSDNLGVSFWFIIGLISPFQDFPVFRHVIEQNLYSIDITQSASVGARLTRNAEIMESLLTIFDRYHLVPARQGLAHKYCYRLKIEKN